LRSGHCSVRYLECNSCTPVNQVALGGAEAGVLIERKAHPRGCRFDWLRICALTPQIAHKLCTVTGTYRRAIFLLLFRFLFAYDRLSLRSSLHWPFLSRTSYHGIEGARRQEDLSGH
jgi:hypothetical protein